MAYDGSIKIDTAIDGSGFSSGLSKLGGVAKATLTGMTTLISGAAAALGAGAVAGVKYNAQMEQYMTSFTTMLGSANKATSMVGDLKKFAAATPFEFSDLAKGSQTLLSFGTSAGNLMPTLKMLGDVSQGNKEKFDSLTLAFGQVSSAGKMSGQDLLQFINAGFNPLNEISKKTGESMSDLRDRMAAGGISAQEVGEAFKSATSAGGLFYNAMDAQSKTFSGQLSTLKDNAMQFLGNLTQGLENTLKDTALPLINGYMTQLSGAFASGGFAGVVSALGTVLSNALTQLAQQAPGVINMAVSLVQSFVTGIGQNAGSLSSAVVSMATTLITGILNMLPSLLTTGMKIIAGLISGINTNLPSLLSTATNIAVQLITAFIDNAPQILQAGITFLNGLVDALPVIIQNLTTALPTLINTIVNFLITSLPTIINGATQLFMAIVNAIPLIIPPIVAALPQIITTLVNGLVSAIPLLINGAVQLLMAIVNAIPIIINALIPAIPQIIDAVVNGLITAMPQLLDGAIKFLMAIIDAIPQIIVALVTNLPKIISTIITTLLNNLPKLIVAAVQLFMALIEAIPQIVVELVKNLPQIITAIVDGLAAGNQALADVGLNLIKGLWQGISNAKDWLMKQISGFFGGVVDNIKNFFGIHSPSHLFRDEIGKMLPPGISVGFEKAMPGAVDDMKAQMQIMVDKMQSGVSAEQSTNSLCAGSLQALEASSFTTDNNTPAQKEALTFNQYNTSPKALTPSEVERQTRNGLRRAGLNF